MSNQNPKLHITLGAILPLIGFGGSAAADWPEFRGPDGQGRTFAKGTPLHWSENKNVAWKTAIPGKGWSTPVIKGNQIWLTTATGAGRSLRAISLSRNAGKLLHNIELFQTNKPARAHAKNSHATPTPVLSGDQVFVHFGSEGTACLSAHGKVLWKNTSLRYYQPYAGASCPVLFRKLLILTCDGSDIQFIVALDKDTGKVVWKTARIHLEAARRQKKRTMSYSTPLVIDVAGRHQVVSPAAEHVAAYDVHTGDEIWWMKYDGYSLVARPVYDCGRLFVIGVEGAPKAVLYAIDPKARGEIPRHKLLWRRTRWISHVPSPLVFGKQLYLISDKGVASCLDASNGRLIWQQRLDGNYSASPVFVEGRIILLNEEGLATVLAAGSQFQLLTTNQLRGKFLASPAISGDALYLRSEQYLYCIRAKK